MNLFLMSLRRPFTVTTERGGYFRNCHDVIIGNLVRYPASIDVASVWSFEKKR